VKILTAPNLQVSATEGVIEPTTDASLPSFDEPTELLASVAVKMTIRVDELLMGSARHDKTFGADRRGSPSTTSCPQVTMQPSGNSTCGY